MTDQLGEQTYWNNGEPAEEIKRTNRQNNEQKYWSYGSPSSFLFKANKPKNWGIIIS